MGVWGKGPAARRFIASFWKNSCFIASGSHFARVYYITHLSAWKQRLSAHQRIALSVRTMITTIRHQLRTLITAVKCHQLGYLRCDVVVLLQSRICSSIRVTQLIITERVKRRTLKINFFTLGRPAAKFVHKGQRQWDPLLPRICVQYCARAPRSKKNVAGIKE